MQKIIINFVILKLKLINIFTNYFPITIQNNQQILIKIEDIWLRNLKKIIIMTLYTQSQKLLRPSTLCKQSLCILFCNNNLAVSTIITPLVIFRFIKIKIISPISKTAQSLPKRQNLLIS